MKMLEGWSVGRTLVRCSVVVVVLLVTRVGLLYWLDVHQLDQQLYHWHGFGPERGVYDFTLVTALYDIGRGKWRMQGRTYNTYLTHLTRILKLDVNLVIFIEPKGADVVRRVRKGRESRTLLVESELSDLPYYEDLPRVQEIMDSPQFQQDNENFQRDKVESVNALYDVATNSKAWHVQRAMELNPFNSSYFVWLDAGLGHGDASLYPRDGVWHPRHLLSRADRVTFTALSDMESSRPFAWRLHKIDTAIMAGGIFAGGTAAMQRYCRTHHEVWREMLNNGVVDDDQTTFALTYFRDPGNYNPVLGDWYDLLKPWT